MNKLLTLAAGTLAASGAVAHDGHGMEGSHWHATDVWGLAALAALVALGLWFSRRK
jgi:hydrogenase/urease accessory protein HupE